MLDDQGANVVRVFKGWFGFRKFYKALRACEEAFPDSVFVIHMRIGTSGLKNADNCHPFSIFPDAGFAHNGILSGLGDAVRSDTRIFVEDTLSKLQHGFWDNAAVIEAITDCANAASSKFVLLTGDGSYWIFNESMGHWHDGCWFSNRSYVLPRKSTTPTHVCTPAANITPIVPAGMTLCVHCNKEVPTHELALNRYSLKVCKPCLESMYGVVQIRCESCMIANPLTEEMIKGTGAFCDYCREPMEPDDTMWQLISSAVGS